jgi:hypothetical protein
VTPIRLLMTIIKPGLVWPMEQLNPGIESKTQLMPMFSITCSTILKYIYQPCFLEENKVKNINNLLRKFVKIWTSLCELLLFFIAGRLKDCMTCDIFRSTPFYLYGPIDCARHAVATEPEKVYRKDCSFLLFYILSVLDYSIRLGLVSIRLGLVSDPGLVGPFFRDELLILVLHFVSGMTCDILRSTTFFMRILCSLSVLLIFSSLFFMQF